MDAFTSRVSRLLRSNYKRYIGIDVDDNAVNYSRRNIQSIHENTRFYALDKIENVRDSIKGNVVICFEFLNMSRMWTSSFLC